MEEPPTLITQILDNNIIDVTNTLSSSPNLEEMDSNGRTAMHAAAYMASVEFCTLLVDSGAKVNVKDKNWITPLHLACMSGNANLVEFLVNNGADMQALDRSYRTVLHTAVSSGNEDVVHRLVNLNCPVNKADRLGLLPTHIAAFRGNAKIMEMLWEQGARRHPLDKKKRSPLFWAAHQGNFEVCNSICRAHQDVSVEDLERADSIGYTPLHAACMSGCTLTVLSLLGVNFNINAQTKRGLTSLHIATMAGMEDVVEVLVSNGASVDITDGMGQTALHKACASGFQDVVEVLIASKANPRIADEKGRLPVHLACANGDTGTIENLILYCDDTFNAVDTDGNTCMHYAAHHGDASLFDLLADNANPSLPNNEGMRPIHVAALHGHHPIVAFLVDRNETEVTLLDKYNRSPLHAAAMSGNSDVINSLLNHGATCSLDMFQRTPLHYAAASGQYQCVTTISDNMSDALKRRVDVNKKSALHLGAAMDDQGFLVQYLVKQGLQVTQADSSKNSPLHIACFYGKEHALNTMVDTLQPNSASVAINAQDDGGRGCIHFAAYNGSYKTLESVLQTPKADKNLVDNDGRSALHILAHQGHDATLEELLDRGANAGLTDKDGMTPLMFACSNGHVACANILLFDEDASVDVNSVNTKNRSALMMASYQGDTDCVQNLIEAGCNVNLQDVNNWTAAFFAAMQGHDDVLDVLVSQGEATLDQKDKDGLSILHFAAMNGHDGMVTGLINMVDANGVDKFGHTPLHYAAYHGHDGCVAAFLDEETDVKWKNENESSFSALHCACKNGHEGCLESLLTQEAALKECNATDALNRTPLHHAARNGHSGCVQLLLEANASINAVNNHNFSALMMACKYGHEECAQMIYEEASEEKVDLALVDKFGNTALHLALMEKGNSGCALTMLKLCYKDSLQQARPINNLGKTLLHLAAERNYEDCIEFLLDNNADPLVDDVEGYSPLQCLVVDPVVRDCLSLFVKSLTASSASSDKTTQSTI
eukprot:m.136088 g.136088  ORF g.136088 m.136088 type:complete len:1000 (+) comp10424_c0_seq1:78-3077(+)